MPRELCQWPPFSNASLAAVKLNWLGRILAAGIECRRLHANCHISARAQDEMASVYCFAFTFPCSCARFRVVATISGILPCTFLMDERKVAASSSECSIFAAVLPNSEVCPPLLCAAAGWSMAFLLSCLVSRAIKDPKSRLLSMSISALPQQICKNEKDEHGSFPIHGISEELKMPLWGRSISNHCLAWRHKHN